jgi:hypothetical protein
MGWLRVGSERPPLPQLLQPHDIPTSTDLRRSLTRLDDFGDSPRRVIHRQLTTNGGMGE